MAETTQAPMAGHVFDPTVLREYDIRGIVGETLGPADAHAIGCALGTIVARNGGRKVCVGYDGRLSSPDLEQALVEGFCAAGIDVLRVGRGPSPMLYFSVFHHQSDGGVMVTGSHNPPDHNGFKMMLGTASFYGENVQRLGEIAAAGDYETGSGVITDAPVYDAYVDAVARGWRGGRGLSVAWDAGNGAAGEAMVQLTSRLPGRHILLNAAVDGTFPNHHPDPSTPETLVQLQETVVAEGCDLGIAFDGDGDRIGAVDGEGHIVWPDQLMIVFAEEILAEQAGAEIIADVKASQTLFDRVAALGGTPLMWRTGNTVIKDKLRESGAPFAGEMSGHLFFADHFGIDDGLYAAARLVSLLARREESLAEICAALPKVENTPDIRVPCAEDRKFVVIEEVRARLAAAGVDAIGIDGVRVNTDDGWWLLRASNTQAVLSARCEAADAAGLERLKAVLVAQLQESGVSAPDF